MANWADLKQAIISGKMHKKVLKVSLNQDYGTFKLVLTPISWKPNPSETMTTLQAEENTRFGSIDTRQEHSQTFMTENLGHWYAVEVQGKVYAFSENSTKTKLVLHGIYGLNNGPKFMQEVSELYENMELGEKAIPMPSSIWKCIPEELRRVPQWFPERCDRYEGSQRINGLLAAGDGELKQGKLYRSGDVVMNAYGVRPCIPIRDGVQVDLDSDPVEGLRIRMG